jgi:hypothetical protein
MRATLVLALCLGAAVAGAWAQPNAAIAAKVAAEFKQCGEPPRAARPCRTRRPPRNRAVLGAEAVGPRVRGRAGAGAAPAPRARHCPPAG